MATVEISSLGSTTLIVGWVFTALALLSILLHSLHRHCMGRKPGWEGSLLLASFALSLALMILTTWAVATQGQGKHKSDESRSHFVNAAKSLLTNEILWGIVNTMMRLGPIGLTYRIFRPHPSSFWIMLLCTISSIAYAAALIVTPLVICTPISASWDNTVPGNCGDQNTAFLVLEILGLSIDLVLIIWPIPLILGVHLSLRTTLQLITVFSVGSL